ncbi:MAG: hypothetical protein EZS28_029544, partial [Streblomastix strix]
PVLIVTLLNCYSDSKIPKIGYWGSATSGAFDQLLKNFSNTIFVFEEGDDINYFGTSALPVRTLRCAVAIVNPRKDILNGGDLNEQQLSNVTIRTGTFSDFQVSIMAEYIVIYGNGFDNTKVTNIAPGTLIEDSCLFYIAADNINPRVEITRIHFQQTINGSSINGAWPLIQLNDGRVTVSSCKFSQSTDVTSSQFNYLEVITPKGKGIISMEDCSFTNISSGSALTIDTSHGDIDMQIRRCNFIGCQSYQSYDETSSQCSSPIVIFSSFSYATSPTSVPAFIVLPVVVFTNCTFTNNSGIKANVAEIKGEQIKFGFSSCTFTGTSEKYIYVSSTGEVDAVSLMITQAFGGCKASTDTTNINLDITSPASTNNLITISTKGEVDEKTKYVRNGGNDGSGHTGENEAITDAYATVTKAISESFSGSSKPLLINIGQGTFSDHQLNAGARGIKIVGKCIVNTTMINSKGAEPKAWLASTVGV